MKTVKLIILTAMCIVSAGRMKAQIITTYAGICDSAAFYNGDGGQATNAKLRVPSGLTVDNLGNLYFSEGNNHVVRKVNAATGVISTIAGNGISGFSGDGMAGYMSQLNGPKGISIDKYGNVYIADAINKRVRKVDHAGIITTVAGTGSSIVSGDGGIATAAGLGNGVSDVHVDTAGNIYIAAGNYFRKVNTAGIITTIAGNGTGGYTGDGGFANSASISNVAPFGLDMSGNIYFTNQFRVRKINTVGIINAIAGQSGMSGGYSGDGGPATAAMFNSLYGVFIDSCGNVYIADGGNGVIRVISNTNGNVYTIAGNGTNGYSGDGGTATSAKLRNPYSVFLSKSNQLFIADYSNHCIRKVALPRCDSMVFPVMVEEVDAGAEVAVLPTEGYGAISVRVNGTGRAQVAIVTMQGYVLRKYELKRGITTPLEPQLLPGMYLVVVQTETGRVTKKVVVR